MAECGLACVQVRAPALPGLPSHAPSRAFSSVMMNPVAGEEWYPMLGLAAAPEIVMAVPSEIGSWCPLA